MRARLGIKCCPRDLPLCPVISRKGRLRRCRTLLLCSFWLLASDTLTQHPNWASKLQGDHPVLLSCSIMSVWAPPYASRAERLR